MNLTPEEPWFAGLEERRQGRKGRRMRLPERQHEDVTGSDSLATAPADEPALGPEPQQHRGRRPFLPGHAPHPRRAQPLSPAQEKKRRATIGALLANCLSERDIVAACLDPKAELGFARASQVRRAIVAMKDEWAQQDVEQQGRNKAAATRRVLTHIQRAVAEKKWAPVAQFERLLAELQGTLEPIRIEVDVTQAQRAALAGAIAAMNPEQVIALAQLRREIAAAERARMLPAPEGTATDRVVLDAFAEVEGEPPPAPAPAPR